MFGGSTVILLLEKDRFEADEDILRYTVTAGGSETAVDETYSQIMSSSGTHTLVFTAYDSWGASATHTVTVTAKVSEKTYAVFGLGRYGIAVAKELAEHGVEVIAVDINAVIVNDMSSDIPICKCADVTDPEAVKQLGIANVDVVVIE